VFSQHILLVLFPVIQNLTAGSTFFNQMTFSVPDSIPSTDE